MKRIIKKIKIKKKLWRIKNYSKKVGNEMKLGLILKEK